MVTLKAARVNKGYTQEQAAKLLNISPDTLGKYERAETFPTIPILKRMEDLYDVEYKDIFFKTNYGLTVDSSENT